MTTTPNPGQPTDAAPCPFCGGTDGSVQEGSTFRWMRWSCDCGVAGREVRVKTIRSGSADQWEAQWRIDAVKAWNTRALLATKASASDAGWMPIETAPQSGKDVLLFWRHAGIALGRFTCETTECGWRCDGDQVMPKNQQDCIWWMPLPVAPQPSESVQAQQAIQGREDGTR